MKIKNEKYANQVIITGAGEVKFDDKGIATEPTEALQVLSELEGFELVKDSKEEVKEPEKDSEEAPKRSKKKAKSEE